MATRHKYFRPFFVAVIFCICHPFTLVAQDTLDFNSKMLIPRWQIKQQGYLLKGLTVKSTGTFSLLENIVNSMPATAKKYKGDTCYINNQIMLSGCSLSKLQTYYTKLYFPTSKLSIFKIPNHFTIEESRLEGEPDLSNLNILSGKLAALNHDTLKTLHITNSKGWFSLYNNKIDGNLEVSGSDIDQLDISQNDFTSSSNTAIAINQSTIRKFSLTGNNIKNVTITLANDTLIGTFDLTRIANTSIKTDSGGKADFVFKNCLINSKFILAESSKFLTVKFINCNFGKDANIENLYVQQLIFDNCNNFMVPQDLNIIKSPKLDISFINSDLKNFRLNYLGKFTLFFPDSTKDEDKISTYENLVAKFKLEGKLESFQNVDIDYTQFKDRKAGLWGSIRDIISRCWWYYSYRKYYILFWTIGLLLIFYFLNLLWWDRIKAVYPIIAELPLNKYYNSGKPDIVPAKRSYLTILIFTAFIFFSLKINFEKLVYRDTKTLAYFFLQYILGLVCVFFIANAILKIQ